MTLLPEEPTLFLSKMYMQTAQGLAVLTSAIGIGLQALLPYANLMSYAQQHLQVEHLTLIETYCAAQDMHTCLDKDIVTRTLLGNASLFTKRLFIIFVPLNPPPPNQQNDEFPLDFLLKGPQTKLRTLSQNCEQTLQKLRTNRIMNKRAFLIYGNS